MSDLQTIKQLRERTGAGMVDCQKALDESNGDIEKAVEILRKKGLEKAGKKAERSTKEGLISFACEGKKVAVVGLTCETDFVSRNEDFIKVVNDFAIKLLNTPVEEFKPWAEEHVAKELISKIGENMKLVAAEVIEGEVIGTYLHSNKKLATVVVLRGGTVELANDIAMQVAAMSPKYVQSSEVPADEIVKEKEIYREQMKGENKPEAVIEKIIEGKLNKFYSEVCLLNQAFIKDDKMTIEQLLAAAGAQVVRFSRFQI
ncbi:MAG: translation elongation factor Ts [Patescibacteria group bacterium]|jgi:elongation factor Ts